MLPPRQEAASFPRECIYFLTAMDSAVSTLPSCHCGHCIKLLKTTYKRENYMLCGRALGLPCCMALGLILSTAKRKKTKQKNT
jgi:hypothetical protein